MNRSRQLIVRTFCFPFIIMNLYSDCGAGPVFTFLKGDQVNRAFCVYFYRREIEAAGADERDLAVATVRQMAG